MSETKHTRGMWHALPNIPTDGMTWWSVVSHEAEIEIAHELLPEDAARIVQAVNSHDGLVEALEKALAHYQIQCDLAERLGITVPITASWVPIARAALAAAQVQP